jgi:hypothetical protein
MAINSMKHPFTAMDIEIIAPHESGVYGLYDHGSGIIFYGYSKFSIKVRLRSHLSGAEGSYTKNAVYFNFEVCSDPKKKEHELIEEYEQTYGKPPKYNTL